ncbi:MAG: histidine phosphatase family protein [Acidobacteriota bacterium]|nr:histidine phosphatase family protein [Acidobacteriota bacterium]
MTKLLLIRHGIAEEHRSGEPDTERALSEEGWIKTRAAMAGLVSLGFLPSRGISSPYRRAMESMACLKEAALAVDPKHPFPVGVSDGFTPGADVEEMDHWLRRLVIHAGPAELIAVTSHEPFLSSLIRQLTGQSLDVKKASCTVIEWTGEGWKFERHFKPAELRGEG